MLGPLEVRSGGRTVAVGRGKQRTLLALLALNSGRVVPVETLIDQLWGDEPPATASTALQVYVSKLRKSLGERAIETRPPGYLVEGDLDARRFEALVAKARGAEPERASALLREALALWRGDALADVELAVEAARLEELRLDALERRIDADLERGLAAELVPELETLVAAQPLRESFRAQLMLALYRAGRQAEALDAYRDARRTFVEELGLEPSRRLQDLEQAMLRQDERLASAHGRTLTASAVFLDVGVEGEVETLVESAVSEAVALFAKAEHVERGLGDAVLAVYLDADEAVRAAAAALARLSERFGEGVRPRAGLATGDVSLGERAGGVAAVLAARRVRSAGPNEVAVGERTAAAARAHRFERRGDAFVLVR